MPSLQLLRKLAQKLNADEEYLATGVERVEQISPELVDEEVTRRLDGGASEPEIDRPAGGLENPADRARVLWEHSRALLEFGERAGAARYARDALALLEYAEDLERALPVGGDTGTGATGGPAAPALHSG